MTLLTLIVWLVIGTLTAYVATKRGRNPYNWFFIGLLLGLIGLLILVMLPVYVSKDEERPDTDNGAHNTVITIKPVVIQPVQQYLSYDWFFIDKTGKQQGPLSFDTFRSKWVNKEFDETSYVWCESMKEWQRVADLKDLLKVLG
jgi:hypothetical protein